MTIKMNPGKRIMKFREFPKSFNSSGNRFVPNKYLRTESSARNYGKEMCEDLGIDYRILYSSLDGEYAVYIVDGRAVSHATSKDPYEQIEELEERIEHASSESEKYDLKRKLMYLKAMVGVSNPKDNNWAVVSTDKLGRPGETYRGMRIVKSGLTNEEAKKMAFKFRSQLTRTEKDFYRLTYKVVRIPKPKPLKLSNKMVVISTKDEENPKKSWKSPLLVVGALGLAWWYFNKK